jgi:hypothetical protein
VRLLRDDLKGRGIVSKRWTTSTGRELGGTSFDRGALYCLLKNRVYIGETTHKGASYPGEHQAIVASDLFDAVQKRLAASRRRTLGKPSVPQDAPLAGLVFDHRGTPMLPTYSTKPGGRRYTYYASRLREVGSAPDATISRVPAGALEGLVTSALSRLGIQPAASAAKDTGGDIRLFVQRIDVGSNALTLYLDRRAALHSWRAVQDFGDRELVRHHQSHLAAGEELVDAREWIALRLPVRARFRGGRAGMLQAPGMAPRSPAPDPALIKALARAHHWKDMLMAGEVASVEALAARVKQERRHVGRTLSLAFLAPDLTKTILRGEQPAGLRLTHLLDADIPLSWREQRIMFGHLAATP